MPKKKTRRKTAKGKIPLRVLEGRLAKLKKTVKARGGKT